MNLLRHLGTSRRKLPRERRLAKAATQLNLDAAENRKTKAVQSKTVNAHVSAALSLIFLSSQWNTPNRANPYITPNSNSAKVRTPAGTVTQRGQNESRK